MSVAEDGQQVSVPVRHVKTWHTVATRVLLSQTLHLLHRL